MATKAELLSAAFVLSFLFLSVSLAYGMKDPEVLQCKHQCRQLRRVGEEDKQRCFERCDEYYKEKRRRERSRQGHCEKVLGGSDGEDGSSSLDPQAQLSICQEKCDSLRGEQRQLCRLRCQHSRRREQEEEEEEEEEENDDDEEEENDDSNPYVFEDKHLTTKVKTEQGRVDVLEKFTSKSKLLRGIRNYRVAFLAANPLSFVAPSHWDADAVLFVARGRATIGLVREDKTERLNVEFGDTVKVSAGTPIYMVNRDENEKLFIIKLLRPVNLHGEYEAFYGPGGRDPESFYPGFSSEVLEAALNIRRERLEKLFKQQDGGSIMKASKEQVKAISSRVEEEGCSFWPLQVNQDSLTT
ncbi:sucrose-binding protein-like [Carica papaya]|uniref:sucrose-binding protein-like n=1 Tax=Carica papaya TaxID=3649 RepID=UPI000B8D0F14|nr:sucrose-binding protein-like [Carica papaya]